MNDHFYDLCFIMRPYTTKRNFHGRKRKVNQFRALKRAKLRDSVGVIHTKNLLRCSLLNVDGLNEASLDSVETMMVEKKPDVVILLEKKRRVEQSEMDISVPGYNLREARRSNNAGDRDGGGIALYTKLSDGILFKEHKPDIVDKAHLLTIQNVSGSPWSHRCPRLLSAVFILVANTVMTVTACGTIQFTMLFSARPLLSGLKVSVFSTWVTLMDTLARD